MANTKWKYSNEEPHLPPYEQRVYPYDSYYAPMELWKPIDDSIVPGVKPFYWISNLGNVYSVFSGHYIRHKINTNNYEYVDLSMADGTARTRLKFIHRLVALAFVYNPDPINKIQVNHIDGNKSNNAWCNLEWMSDVENKQHARKLGLYSDERNVERKRMAEEARLLQESKIHTICQMLEDECSNYDIIMWIRDNCPDCADQLSLLNRIKKRISWTHISSQYNIDAGIKYKFSNEEAHAICRCIEAGMMDPNEIINAVYREKVAAIPPKLYASMVKMVQRIRYGTYYTNVSSQYTFNKPKKSLTSKLTFEQIHAFCKALETYGKDADLNYVAKMAGIDIGAIEKPNEAINMQHLLYAIRRRASYTEISNQYNF